MITKGSGWSDSGHITPSLSHSHFSIHTQTHTHTSKNPPESAAPVMQLELLCHIFACITSRCFKQLSLLPEPCCNRGMLQLLSNGVILGNDVTIYRPCNGRAHFVVVCLSVCFPFVWEPIISGMVATWNIWRGINSCLLSLPTSESPIRTDSP